MTFLLKDAEVEIIAALQRLLEKPKEHRPFLVIEDTVTKKFVQFCGSDREPLLFDVPAIDLLRQPVPLHPETGKPNLTEAAQAAIHTLESFGLPDFAVLHMTEEITEEEQPS